MNFSQIRDYFKSIILNTFINKSCLDKIGEDKNGNLLYDNKLPASEVKISSEENNGLVKKSDGGLYVRDLSDKLVDEKTNIAFKFAITEDGKYGYVVTDWTGADTVVPFKKNGIIENHIQKVTIVTEQLKGEALTVENTTTGESFSTTIPTTGILELKLSTEGSYVAYNGGTRLTFEVSSPTYSIERRFNILKNGLTTGNASYVYDETTNIGSLKVWSISKSHALYAKVDLNENRFSNIILTINPFTYGRYTHKAYLCIWSDDIVNSTFAQMIAGKNSSNQVVLIEKLLTIEQNKDAAQSFTFTYDDIIAHLDGRTEFYIGIMAHTDEGSVYTTIMPISDFSINY